MGFAKPRKPDGPGKEELARQADLTKKQNELLAQQEREKTQRQKQIEQERIAALRGRFGGSSMGGSSSGDAGSLYSRITGR